MSNNDERMPAWQDCMTYEISEWMGENYNRPGAGSCMGALTGTDWKALRCVVALMHLHAYAPNPGHCDALRDVVLSMQEKTRWIAWAIIAMVLNWEDRDLLWNAARLPRIENPPRAKHDDTGRGVAP